MNILKKYIIIFLLWTIIISLVVAAVKLLISYPLISLLVILVSLFLTHATIMHADE